jgi:hypothetical protein
MKIHTEFVYPPIPSRSYDWCAITDDYDGELGSPCGWGSTKEEAIEDLQFQISEMGA